MSTYRDLADECHQLLAEHPDAPADHAWAVAWWARYADCVARGVEGPARPGLAADDVLRRFRRACRSGRATSGQATP